MRVFLEQVGWEKGKPPAGSQTRRLLPGAGAREHLLLAFVEAQSRPLETGEAGEGSVLVSSSGEQATLLLWRGLCGSAVHVQQLRESCPGWGKSAVSLGEGLIGKGRMDWRPGHTERHPQAMFTISAVPGGPRGGGCPRWTLQLKAPYSVDDSNVQAGLL
jgi:hypothetical protein